VILLSAYVLVTQADPGASPSGLYELAGIVTHKGASAESGHYIAFVRRDAFADEDAQKKVEETGETDDMWYKFDDEKACARVQSVLLWVSYPG